MRVLVIHTYYQLKGGEDSVVANEIELLRSNGMTVDLLSFYNSGGILFKLLQMPFNYHSYRQTKERIKSFRPDVVHIHNLHFGGSAAVLYAIRKCHIPVVMTLHNYRLICPSGSLFHNNKLFLDSAKGGFPWKAVTAGVYQNSSVLSFWLALSMYIHEKAGSWKIVDRFILLGEHSRELFAGSRLAQFAERMAVKPNFCYSLPGQHHAESVPYYLYIGRLTGEKGLPVLLKAFAANQLSLRIIGTGPLEKMVLEYAANYPNIVFMGEQPKDDVATAIENSTALIFPSLWYETFGMVVIEAFSKGIPVIGSDLGNIKHLIQDGYNGLLFSPGDPQDLNAKITGYEQLPEALKKEYRDNARATYVEKYGPDENAAQLTALYEAVISSK